MYPQVLPAVWQPRLSSHSVYKALAIVLLQHWHSPSPHPPSQPSTTAVQISQNPKHVIFAEPLPVANPSPISVQNHVFTHAPRRRNAYLRLCTFPTAYGRASYSSSITRTLASSWTSWQVSRIDRCEDPASSEAVSRYANGSFDRERRHDGVKARGIAKGSLVSCRKRSSINGTSSRDSSSLSYS